MLSKNNLSVIEQKVYIIYISIRSLRSPNYLYLK